MQKFLAALMILAALTGAANAELLVICPQSGDPVYKLASMPVPKTTIHASMFKSLHPERYSDPVSGSPLICPEHGSSLFTEEGMVILDTDTNRVFFK